MLKIFREYLQNVLVGGTRAVGGTDPPLFFLPWVVVAKHHKRQ